MHSRNTMLNTGEEWRDVECYEEIDEDARKVKQLPLFAPVTFPELPCEWETCGVTCGAPSEFYAQRFPKRGPVTAHLMLCAHCLPIVEARDKDLVRERILTLSPFVDAVRRDGKWGSR